MRELIPALLLLSPAALSQDSQIREILNRAAADGLFHGAASMMVGDEIVYQGSHGLSDVEAGVPNGPDTRFRLCSLTKAFTQTAVMRLVEAGKLELDAPLSTYRPGFDRDIGGKITLRHLLSNSSGLPRELHRDPARSGVRFDRHGMAGPFLDSLDLTLDFEPGARESYSNVGYWVLGAVIESATGKTYAEALRELVFEPLGMEDSGFGQEELGVDGHAIGYVTGEGSLTPAMEVVVGNRFSSGGLYSTVNDLQKFLRSFRTEDLLRDASKDLIWNRAAGRTLFAGGHLPGFTNMFCARVDDGRVFIILNNVDVPDPARLQDLVDEVFVASGGRPYRQRRVIEVKSAREGLPDTEIVRVTRKLVDAIAEASETGVRDWYLAHRPDPDQPLEELAKTLAGLSREMGGFQIVQYMDRGPRELFLIVKGSRPGEVWLTVTASADDVQTIDGLEIQVRR